MTAVLRHELHSYFTTPVGYVFLCMYTLLSGVVFVFVNIGQHMSASMNLLFSGLQLPFLLIAPLLTMRLFAEEKRMRTDQLLLTAPIRVHAIVLGKMLAAALMLLLAMGLTLLLPLLISPWAQVSLPQVMSVFLGYYLLDVTVLSMGLFISSLCVNQITAAVITLGLDLLIYLCEHYIMPQVTAAGLTSVTALLQALPSTARLSDFASGVISLSDICYFLILTALMLLFTCRAIQHRRFAKG